MTSHTQRVAVMAALHTHYLTQNASFNPQVLPEQDYALITYAPVICVSTFVMMAIILVGVCVLLRKKNKRIQEATSLNNLPWIDTLEIFTVSGRDAAAGIYLPPATPGTPSPPPTYDTVVKSRKDKEAQEKEAAAVNIVQIEHETGPSRDEREETDGLPTYEAALEMEQENRKGGMNQ